MVTSDSIRQRIYKLWTKNPYITAKPACKKLNLNYKKHGSYIRKELSHFRSYHKFGLPQKALNPHRRIFVWENVPRSLLFCGDMCRSLEKLGWSEVSNRNGMWIFRDDRGSVHWYKGGLVRLYLRGAVQLARAKELFCKAFSWFSNEQFVEFLDCPLREELRHWVFDVGAPMPRFDIRNFEKSHGIRIFTDGSHPTSLEVEETRPLSMIQFEEVITTLGSTVNSLALQIKEHMKLIQEWQREADTHRKERGFIKRLIDRIW